MSGAKYGLKLNPQGVIVGWDFSTKASTTSCVFLSTTFMFSRHRRWEMKRREDQAAPWWKRITG